MKKALSLALAATMLIPTLAPVAASAQPGGYDHDYNRGPGDRDRDHRDWRDNDHRDWRDRDRGWRQFHRGERFDMGRARYYRELDWRRDHRLRRPPYGYHWVRNGDDALLVGITTGVVASIIIGAGR